MNKQVILGILAAVIGVAGYFFKDKIFNGAADVTPVPLSELALIKSSVIIDEVTTGKVSFRVVLEAKKDVDITSLRAFYFDKRNKTTTTYGSGNRQRSKRSIASEELGNLDLSDGKISLKAGEKKEISAYFTLNEILPSHYLEINGIASEPCSMEDLADCITKQMAEAEKDPKSREIYMLEKLKK
jgi:hypothetical protein